MFRESLGVNSRPYDDISELLLFLGLSNKVNWSDTARVMIFLVTAIEIMLQTVT